MMRRQGLRRKWNRNRWMTQRRREPKLQHCRFPWRRDLCIGSPAIATVLLDCTPMPLGGDFNQQCLPGCLGDLLRVQGSCTLTLPPLIFCMIGYHSPTRHLPARAPDTPRSPPNAGGSMWLASSHAPTYQQPPCIQTLKLPSHQPVLSVLLQPF